MSDSSLGKKAVSGSIYTLIGDYAVYGLNFIRGIVLARLLAPEIFGVFALADFFKGLFGQANQIGFDQAVIAYRQEDNPDSTLQEAYNGHLLMNIATAGVGIIATLIAAPFLLKTYDPRVTWALLVLMLGLLLQAIGSTPATFLRKNFEFKKLSLVRFAGTVAAVTLAIVFAARGWGIWALVALQVTMVGTNMLLFWILTPWRPTRQINGRLNRKILKFGGTLWIGGLFGFLMLKFDDFLVGQFVGLTMLGFYSKAYSLAQQPLGLFSQVLNKVAAPAIAEVKNDLAKLERGFNLVLGLVFKGTIFVAMILFIWSPQLIEFLIGAKWLPAVPLLRGLMIFLVVQPVWEMAGSFLTYTGKPREFVKGQAVQALGLVGLGTGIVYLYGGMGAALTVSGLVGAVTVYFLWKHVDSVINLDWWNNFGVPLIAAVAAGAIGNWLLASWLSTGIGFWLGLMAIPAFLFLLSLLILQGKTLLRDVKFLYGIIKAS